MAARRLAQRPGAGGAYQVCAADDKMLYSVSGSLRQGEGERCYLKN